MIKLHQFAPALGLPNASSFCLKVETYLRMIEIPYKSVYENDLRKAPKGKMPYIVDGDKTIADSNFIIEYLKETYGDRLDAHLSPVERAISLAMQRLLEENIYWTVVYHRWEDPANWQITKSAFFAELPPLLRPIIPFLARQSMRKSMRGHGMGRHSAAEVERIGLADLQALVDFLADKPFFMGAQPTSLDASAYGSLANLIWTPFQSAIKDRALKMQNINDYCQRMHDRYYQEHL